MHLAFPQDRQTCWQHNIFSGVSFRGSESGEEGLEGPGPLQSSLQIRTIKVCVSCSLWCPGTSMPRASVVPEAMHKLS